MISDCQVFHLFYFKLDVGNAYVSPTSESNFKILNNNDYSMGGVAQPQKQ